MSILFRAFIVCKTQYQYKLEQQQILQRFKNSDYTTRTLEEAVNKTSTKHNIPTTDNQQQYSKSRREALMNIGTKNSPTKNRTNAKYIYQSPTGPIYHTTSTSTRQVGHKNSTTAGSKTYNHHIIS
jgi:hypothetical protein